MGTDLRFIVPTAGTPFTGVPTLNHVARPGTRALGLTGRAPGIDTILWDTPAFWGYSKSTASSITPGAIYTNVSSGEAPLVVHASASNVTASGTETLTGNAINPYMHLQYTWRVTLNGSLVPSEDEITDPNTLESVDMYTDQIGGEACFIFHEPGNFNIILTATSANGTSEQQTKLIPVSVPTYAHKWFDPDSAGGDGLQHWDASALTNGTYTNVSGILTQPGSGAFTNYNHTLATAQTYDTDNYNWIWISGFGHKRIASKTNEDTIVLLDKLGSDQTGVTSSTGPLNAFNPATDVDSDTAHHLKVGRTYSITTGIQTADTNGLRFMGWGGSGKYTLKAAANFTMINTAVSGGSVQGNRIDTHKMILDGDHTGGRTAPLRTGVFDQDTGDVSYVLDRCELSNTSDNRVLRIESAQNAVHFCAWGCDFDARQTGTERKDGPAFIFMDSHTAHSAVIGCRTWAESTTGPTFEHHYYITGEHGHRLRDSLDFIENVRDASYCLNENSGGAGGFVTDYMTIRNCRFRNADWGIDASNVLNDFVLGIFDNVVIIGNSFDGTPGSGNLGATRGGAGIFWASTDGAFIGHNIALNIQNGRGLYDELNDRPASTYYFDGNTTYNCPMASVGSGAANFQIVNTTSTGDDVIEELLVWGSTNNGANTYIQDNQFYAPNDADGAYIDDVNVGGVQNLTDLNGFTNNSNNTQSDPLFNDPANKDFRTANVKFEVVDFIVPAGTSPTTLNVDLTPGFGVPKGIMMVQSGHWSILGSGYNNGSFCVGYSDGTNNVCVNAQHDSEDTPGQKCFRTMFNNHCSVRTQSSGDPTEGVRNSMSATFETDRVVLDIDTLAAGESFKSYIVAIGGNDVESVFVGSSGLGTGGAEAIAVGHAPDMFFTLSDHDSTFNAQGTPPGRSADLNASISYGVAINNFSVSQMCSSWYSLDAPSSDPTTNTVGIYNDSILASMDHGGVENWAVELTSFGANGVTVTPTSNPGNALLGYMSIKFARAVNMAIVNTTVPVGSGNVSATAGFEPSFGMWLNINGPTVYNTPTDTSWSLATTCFDTTSIRSQMNNGANGITASDSGAGSAWAREESGFNMIDAGGSGSIDVTASGYTFTATGVDFEMTNWPANTVPGRMLLLGVN